MCMVGWSKYIGHKREEDGAIQSLKAHLKGTGALAEQFAAIFGSGQMGYVLGRYHDIGKYSQAFQKYIRQGGGTKVDHSTAAAKEFAGRGMVSAAFCAAGHHGGLPDRGTQNHEAGSATFLGRLKKQNLPDYQSYQDDNPPIPKIPELSWVKALSAEGKMFELMVYMRMLFSCLVDADFLDTERVMNMEPVKRGGFEPLAVLKKRLDRYIAEKLSTPKSPINQKRYALLQQCITAGDTSLDSVLNLTMPTGAGKTIASLAYALHRALRPGMEKQRVIYVIPYTSIIEQTAGVFRSILGNQNVVEHHSNVDYDDTLDEKMNMKRLACENWDAPIVVTTNVQFFESLFARRTSRCRKLHNIAGSVIIFDEAQMIPLDFLQPCTKILGELPLHYGCVEVLCTATQPSLGKFFPGRKIPEICQEVAANYAFFQRTQIKVLPGMWMEENLAEKFTRWKQVLCIVNTKRFAQHLYSKLTGEGNFHLSTNMYPVHRERVLDEIKKRLKAGLPCRVVATSLVEAGVDVDFPVVWREFAGLDSIIQAAGRCNRENKNPKEESWVYVFRTPDTAKNQRNSRLRTVTAQVCEKFTDISRPEAIQYYFDGVHKLEGNGLDRKNILATVADTPFPFSKVEKDFVLIEEATKLVFIPTELEAQRILVELKKGIRNRSLLRRAGRYMVSVYSSGDECHPKAFEKLLAVQKITMLDEELAVLLDLKLYDLHEGLHQNIEEGQEVFM